MFPEVNVDLSSEARTNMALVIMTIEEFMLQENTEEWRGDYNTSISHKLCPGQESDCGALVEIIEVENCTKTTTLKCLGCGQVFSIHHTDLALS